MLQYKDENTSNKNERYQYTFTVFTPTYNRAHTIERVYNSLINQTFRHFEWLIVDDGSSDNTEELIKKWINEDFINIRYYYQNNRGKHTAINKGVREAKGEFFLILDSDDSCVPESLERFKHNWDNIPEDKKKEFSGITVHCMDTSGNLIGDEFPKDIKDISPLQMMSKFDIIGEKWGFHKTDIFRELPFLEIYGEKFIPEGLIWNRMASKFKVRYVNDVLRIYEYSTDSLSASLLKIRCNSPKGTRLFYQEYNKYKISYKLRVRCLINVTTHHPM